LPENCFGIADIDNAGGKGKQFSKLRGTEAPRSCDDLETIGLRAYGNGLDEAVGADGLCIMFRKRLCGRCGGKPHGWWWCAF
jgi:hypothetical protein